MAYMARDIEVNENGRFTMVAGVDNVVQKVEKYFIPLLATFVGQKTSVALGNALGVVQLVDTLGQAYVQIQNNTINVSVYDNDDSVNNFDSVIVTQQTNPVQVDVSFRILQPSSSITISTSLPVGVAAQLGVSS